MANKKIEKKLLLKVKSFEIKKHKPIRYESNYHYWLLQWNIMRILEGAQPFFITFFNIEIFHGFLLVM